MAPGRLREPLARGFVAAAARAALHAMKWPRNVVAMMLFSTATSYASSGGQAVLYMFFHEQMRWSDGLSTAGVSFYICVMQVFALAGALASDHWLGKLRTQIVSNLIWMMGTIVLLVAVLPTDDATLSSVGITTLAMAGVVMVAFGSGAMSPSLSAFVGGLSCIVSVQRCTMAFGASSGLFLPQTKRRRLRMCPCSSRGITSP